MEYSQNIKDNYNSIIQLLNSCHSKLTRMTLCCENSLLTDFLTLSGDSLGPCLILPLNYFGLLRV